MSKILKLANYFINKYSFNSRSALTFLKSMITEIDELIEIVGEEPVSKDLSNLKYYTIGTYNQLYGNGLSLAELNLLEKQIQKVCISLNNIQNPYFQKHELDLIKTSCDSLKNSINLIKSQFGGLNFLPGLNPKNKSGPDKSGPDPDAIRELEKENKSKDVGSAIIIKDPSDVIPPPDEPRYTDPDYADKYRDKPITKEPTPEEIEKAKRFFIRPDQLVSK